MEISTDHVVYRNARNYWLRNLGDPIIDIYGSTTTRRRALFEVWLEEQGCKIKEHDHDTMLVTDSLGVVPGWDVLYFEKDSDATWFLLRWL